PGCIAFIPSMRQHDFALAPGAHDWLLGVEGNDPIAAPLATTLLHAATRAAPLQGEPLQGDADLLERLRPAIDALRRDPAHAPSAAEAAASCALSPAYFSRRFKQRIGMPWSDYVRTHRLHLASQLLLESDRSVAAISESLGFSTPSHFGELFQRRFGATPN